MTKILQTNICNCLEIYSKISIFTDVTFHFTIDQLFFKIDKACAHYGM